MQLLVGDIVFLRPDAPMADCKSAPKFGGSNGMVYGMVSKVLTGSHDKTMHRARVDWDNGKSAQFLEAHLHKVERDAPPPVVAPHEGYVILLRPTDMYSGVRIGMVSQDKNTTRSNEAWTALATKKPIPGNTQLEQLQDVIGELLPTFGSYYSAIEAVNSVLLMSGFPAATYPDIMRVPLFRSIDDARRNEGAIQRRGYLIFTIPTLP